MEEKLNHARVGSGGEWKWLGSHSGLRLWKWYVVPES